MYFLEKEFWISCSHRLNNDNLTEQENKELFGKCSNFPSHGHNYKVILKFKSEEVSLKTGMIINFYTIKDVFNENIDRVFDHKHLNNCPDFVGIIPTAENMCRVFFDVLSPLLPNLYSVKIYETEGACAEYAK